MFYLDVFTHCVHPRYGFFHHYPTSGGYLEQPWRTMRVLDIMMDEFRVVLKEQAPEP